MIEVVENPDTVIVKLVTDDDPNPIEVPFLRDEFEKIKAAADRAGMTLEAWLLRAVRNAALDPTKLGASS